MMDYRIFRDNMSMYNTPPVFSVYVAMLNLQDLLANGGVAKMGEKNQAKAKLIYSEIDSNPLFKGTAAVEDRSEMNVNFLMTNDALKDEFDAAWKAAGIIGLNGHRSVGGYRASMYNALELESVQVLVDVMNDFSKKHG